MTGQWAPSERQTGTLPLFGRKLRGHFGEAVVGLDDDMVALLEKLVDVPGVVEGGFAHNMSRAQGHGVDRNRASDARRGRES